MCNYTKILTEHSRYIRTYPQKMYLQIIVTLMYMPTDNCEDGDIRLVNGKSYMEGRLELCRYRKWGTVCDKQWTDNHTAVVCRYLGFSDIVGGRF